MPLYYYLQLCYNSITAAILTINFENRDLANFKDCFLFFLTTSKLACGSKAKLLLLKLIQIVAQAVLVMKKLEIEETKTN